jgi:hypothetical protein
MLPPAPCSLTRGGCGRVQGQYRPPPLPYQLDTSRPSSRTDWTRLVPSSTRSGRRVEAGTAASRRTSRPEQRCSRLGAWGRSRPCTCSRPAARAGFRAPGSRRGSQLGSSNSTPAACRWGRCWRRSLRSGSLRRACWWGASLPRNEAPAPSPQRRGFRRRRSPTRRLCRRRSRLLDAHRSEDVTG